MRSRAPFRALNAWSESRGRPACVKEGGVFTSATPARQVRFSDLLHRSCTGLRRGRCLDQPLRPVKPTAEPCSAVLLARGATSTPSPSLPSSTLAIFFRLRCSRGPAFCPLRVPATATAFLLPRCVARGATSTPPCFFPSSTPAIFFRLCRLLRGRLLVPPPGSRQGGTRDSLPRFRAPSLPAGRVLAPLPPSCQAPPLRSSAGGAGSGLLGATRPPWTPRRAGTGPRRRPPPDPPSPPTRRARGAGSRRRARRPPRARR